MKKMRGMAGRVGNFISIVRRDRGVRGKPARPGIRLAK